MPHEPIEVHRPGLQVQPRSAGQAAYVGDARLSGFPVGETRLLTIQPGGFLLKIRRDPTFAFEMLQQLSQRVRIASERALEIARHAGLSQQQVEEILRQFERKPL